MDEGSDLQASCRGPCECQLTSQSASTNRNDEAGSRSTYNGSLAHPPTHTIQQAIQCERNKSSRYAPRKEYDFTPRANVGYANSSGSQLTVSAEEMTAARERY